MQQSGKQRAQKIDPRYHALPDPWVRRKRWLGLLGLMIGLMYSGWLFSQPGRTQLSTGELSRAHQAWNQTGCEQCHLEFVPIRHDALWGDHPVNILKNNQACNACHAVGNHFASWTRAEVLERESCSRCHREHLGVDHSLLSIPDMDCSRCHGDLAKASNRHGTPHSTATHFNESHPKFSFETMDSDPGTIHFSHIQHLRPGQPKTPGDGTAKRDENLPPEFQGRYGVNDEGWIQLQCADCHEPDVGAAAEPSTIVSSHKTFQPVRFDAHCVACHSLDGIPHGLDRQQTMRAIQARLPVELFEYFRQREGESPLQESEILDRELRLRAMAVSKVDGCAKCHLPAPEDSTSLVQASQIPARWLMEGSFAHGAHGRMECKDCHAKAFLSNDSTVQSESESNAIMIDGIESCRSCHIQNPEQRAHQFATNPLVASANCIDCHRYHTDPVPPHGYASAKP
jgi:hypothetical protein